MVRSRAAGRIIARAGLALALASVPAAAAEPELWYAQTLQHGDIGVQMTHFWSKGSWMRAETVIRGHRIVSLVKGDRYYAYDEMLGRGVAVRRSPRAIEADRSGKRPFGAEGRLMITRGAEKVRSEQVGGRSCDVYRQTDTRGRREVCVTPDDEQFPLWVELFSRAQGRSVRTDYLLWFQPEDIPDPFFEPGPEIQLERFEYEQYLEKAAQGPVGPVPILYSKLLHGSRRE